MEGNWNNPLGSFGRQNRNNYGGVSNFYAPHCEVIQVAGRAGAENLRMGPNSSALVLDNTAPIIWFVKTDGSGLINATPYDYTPHIDPPPVDLNDIQQRLISLEEKLNNVQSNTRPTKQRNNNNSDKSAESTT